MKLVVTVIIKFLGGIIVGVFEPIIESITSVLPT